MHHAQSFQRHLITFAVICIRFLSNISCQRNNSSQKVNISTFSKIFAKTAEYLSLFTLKTIRLRPKFLRVLFHSFSKINFPQYNNRLTNYVFSTVAYNFLPSFRQFIDLILPQKVTETNFKLLFTVEGNVLHTVRG